MSTVNPAAAAAVGNITRVGIGNVVVYHARAGYVRDRRSSFPALVLRQHPDDGSLDLFVIMEREDFAVEERVQFQSHNQPHHCWAVVENAPGVETEPKEGLWRDQEPAGLADALRLLTERVAALEARPKAGRPAKPKA